MLPEVYIREEGKDHTSDTQPIQQIVFAVFNSTELKSFL